MFRKAFPLSVLALSGCFLITQFDPEGQPCDGVGDCLPAYACVSGVCRSRDGGMSSDSGTACSPTGTREMNCGDNLDDDCDGSKDCADSDCAAQACNDGDLCTVGEVCSGGMCMRGSAKQCTTPPSPCQAMNGTCNPANGVCVHAPVADGASCGARGADRCCAGTCVNLTQVPGNCGGCGLSCSQGQLCQSINQSSCGTPEPIDTSGRCSCGAGIACPMGQTCGTSGYCVPTAQIQCAAGQVVVTTPGCQAYCRY